MASPDGVNRPPAKSLLFLRNGRNQLAGSARLLVADAQGQGIRVCQRSVEFSRAGSRPQHGEGGYRNGSLGRGSKTEEHLDSQSSWVERWRKFPVAFRSVTATIPALLAKVEKELAAGYQRIKIKIKPGRISTLVAALREKFPRIRLMVDANSAYTLKDTATIEGSRCILPHHDRAAAGLGRILLAHRTPAPTRYTHLPG